MAKQCRVRLGMHSLAPHFFVILPSWVLQPSCCVKCQVFLQSFTKGPYLIIFNVNILSVHLCWLNSVTFVSSNVHKKCTLPDFEEWYQKPLFVLKNCRYMNIQLTRASFSGQVATNLYLCRAVCLSHGTHTTNQWLWPVALTTYIW